jgi:hypothetical protein
LQIRAASTGRDTAADTSVFRNAAVVSVMSIPKPSGPLEIGAVAVGAVVALLVVVPVLPVVLEFVVGTFRAFFDSIVPGGRTYGSDAT